MTTSSSWRLSIGQPRSSKSTVTCSEIGVDVASVEMYCGRGVDDPRELVHVGEVAQRLDPAGGRAGADRDERLRGAPDLLDPLGVVRRRDRALDEREVVRPVRHRARRLAEVGDVDRAGERQQLVLEVEQRELAAVAGGELPDGELRFAHNSRTSMSPATCACE